MKGWSAAAEVVGHVEEVTRESRPALAPPPLVDYGERVTFVEGLRLSMIAMPEDVGAVMRVRPLTKTEAMKLARLDEAEFATAPEYAMSFFEKELGIGELPRARLAPGVKFVIAEKVTWRDIRWFLVEYMSDGDGVVS